MYEAAKWERNKNRIIFRIIFSRTIIQRLFLHYPLVISSSSISPSTLGSVPSPVDGVASAGSFASDSFVPADPFGFFLAAEPFGLAPSGFKGSSLFCQPFPYLNVFRCFTNHFLRGLKYSSVAPLDISSDPVNIFKLSVQG